MGMFDRFIKKDANVIPSNEKGVGVIDDEKIEKAMQRINKDDQLKRIYDYWLGKKDTMGKDMQTKFIEFVAKNRGEYPVYRKENQEFEKQNYEGVN